MKKILSIFLITAMLLSVLLSCANSDDVQTDKPTENITNAAVGGTNEEIPSETEETTEEVISTSSRRRF